MLNSQDLNLTVEAEAKGLPEVRRLMVEADVVNHRPL